LIHSFEKVALLTFLLHLLNTENVFPAFLSEHKGAFLTKFILLLSLSLIGPIAQSILLTFHLSSYFSYRGQYLSFKKDPDWD